MTYKKAKITYRVALDTKKNIFMVYDAHNQQKVAYGITIEQAVQKLENTI